MDIFPRRKETSPLERRIEDVPTRVTYTSRPRPLPSSSSRDVPSVLGYPPNFKALERTERPHGQEGVRTGSADDAPHRHRHQLGEVSSRRWHYPGSSGKGGR